MYVLLYLDLNDKYDGHNVNEVDQTTDKDELVKDLFQRPFRYLDSEDIKDNNTKLLKSILR